MRRGRGGNLGSCAPIVLMSNYWSTHGHTEHCAAAVKLFLCIEIIFSVEKLFLCRYFTNNICLVQVKTRLGKVFNIWDVGGQDKTRPLWRSYTRCTDAIIFVVDSSCEDRFEEARLELLKIAKLTERYAVPILLLANKQDLPQAQVRSTKYYKKYFSQIFPTNIHLFFVFDLSNQKYFSS